MTTTNSIPMSFWDSENSGERSSISIVLPIPDETTENVSFSNLDSLKTSIDYDPARRESEQRKSNAVYESLQQYRDANNGAMTFKANTEYDLLNHVQNGIGDYIRNNQYSDVEAATAILKSIDLYCLGKQWMFHIGHEKGKIIKEFICQCITANRSSSNNNVASDSIFTMVELGTYCGYSAIVLAKAVREFMPDLKFHLYSTEVNPENLEIASKMLQMAKVADYVTLVPLENSSTSSFLSALKKQPNMPSKIDFLFLDHDKEMYLPDLQALEVSGYIQKGTYVAADNVIYYDILHKYREYVHYLSEQSIVKTSLHEVNLEYSNADHKDGIEFTIYQKDPAKN